VSFERKIKEEHLWFMREMRVSLFWNKGSSLGVKGKREKALLIKAHKFNTT